MIDEFIAAHLDESLQEVMALCRQPSVSARREGTRECADLVVALLARHGLEVSKFETAGNPIIVGRIAGRSARTLLCYNHYDVQPPEPLNLWQSPPFEPVIRDGALFARGSRDDKGELVARLAALAAVRHAHAGQLPCGVTFIVEGEEEIGSPHIAEFVLQHRDLLVCNGAIWEEGGIEPEGAPYISLGARGLLAVELSVSTMKTDAHSGRAHFLPSAAWRMVRALQSLKDDSERITIEGFQSRAIPPTALDLEYLAKLPDSLALDREIYGIEHYLNGRTSAEIRRAVFEPTCNIQGITTGYQGDGLKTVIPSKASAKLDFRLVPDQVPSECLELLRRHLDKHGFGDVNVMLLGAMHPAKTSSADPLVALAASAAQEVYAKSAVIYPMVGGSSPIYAFRGPLGGIPVINPGIGYWDNRAHAPNEHIRIADFSQAVRHIARIIDGFADIGAP